MANVNRVILLGNLTRDPELRYTQGGAAVCSFGLAVNRKYTSNGEQRESTTFVDLTAWGKQAELIEKHLGRGQPIFVEGRLEFDTWDGKDGEKKSKLSVTVEQFQFIGSKGDRADGGGSRRQAERAASSTGADDFGDVPF